MPRSMMDWMTTATRFRMFKDEAFFTLTIPALALDGAGYVQRLRGSFPQLG